MRLICISFLAVACLCVPRAFTAEPQVLNLWPDKPPGDIKTLPPEADQTKPEDNLIAGRRIIKLGNVSVPQIAIYSPSKTVDTGTAVLICPGGGHHILAYDLEGTEVAEWLNRIGVTGVVLKYRVPFRDPAKRWLAAVQDGQRAMSLLRQNAEKFGVKRLGILGFSAGGELAGLVSFFGSERQYQPIDEVDKSSTRPDFAVLVYAAGFVDKDTGKMKTHFQITKDAPPTFFVHAWDDNVSVLNPLLTAAELKKAGVASEVHIFASGGHGYGLRHVDGKPVTDWPQQCEQWLMTMGFLK